MSESLPTLLARHKRLQSLHDVSNLIHAPVESQEALQLIVREAVRLMKASSGSVSLLNPTSGLLEISASQNLPGAAAKMKLRLDEGVTGWVARHGKPVRVGDVTQDPRYVAARPGVRSELAVPLEVDGQTRGVLNVDSSQADAFSAEDQELLEQLAVLAARVILKTWLYEQLRLKAHLFESLASVSRTINSTLSLDEALRAITRETAGLMNARMCSLMILDDSRQWLELRAHEGAGRAYLKKPRRNVEESLLGVVVRRKKPLQIANVQTSSRYQNAEIARQEGLVSLLSVPLLATGRPIGTLNLYTGRPYHFSNEEISILSALAELSATAIEKARLYERIVDVEEQLRQNEKLSALGLLAAEVAHEIRNPLTVMKLLYHSLDLKFSEDDPRAKDTRIIEAKIEHLNTIVEQVLDFARTTEPRLAPVDLNVLVEELSLLVRHKFANQNIRLIRDWPSDLPPILGDAPQLEQAFLNVMLNAADAMAEGGTLTLTARALSDSRPGTPPARLEIEFKDTGKGMSADIQKRAFTAVLSTTKTKGTGLGLAIIGRIIETHRGTVHIKSKPGRGTRVIITLPTA